MSSHLLLVAENLAAASERADSRSAVAGNCLPTVSEPQEGMCLPQAGHLSLKDCLKVIEMTDLSFYEEV